MSPRQLSVSQFSLTARVVMAVCWLTIRCGLAVTGHRRPRCCSQASRRCPGQIVEWAGLAGEGQAPVAEVEVVEVELADGLGASRVDGGQSKCEAGGRCEGCGRGLVYLLGQQRLDEVQRSPADVDTQGGVIEDPAGLLAVAKQGTKGREGLVAQASGQGLGGGGDVGGGDLAQVHVTLCPYQQERVHTVEVHSDGVLIAGQAARAALAADAQPVLDVGGHRWRQDREAALLEGIEGRDAVVVQ